MNQAEYICYRRNLMGEENFQNIDRKWERRYENWKETGTFIRCEQRFSSSCYLD